MTHIRSRGGLLVAAVGVVVFCSGCTPSNGGPLAGDRAGDAVSVCAPAQENARVYFGSGFTNIGDQPVVVKQVLASVSTNVSEVDFGFDHGPYRIGTAAHPSNGVDSVDIGPILATLHAASGDVIQPGEEVTLLMTFNPVHPDRDATVDRIEIVYTAGRMSFRETDDSLYQLSPVSCQ